MKKKTTTTPEDFEKQMQELCDKFGGDAETLHLMADDLMVRLLIELGYQAGTKIFDSHEKWYA